MPVGDQWTAIELYPGKSCVRLSSIFARVNSSSLITFGGATFWLKYAKDAAYQYRSFLEITASAGVKL